MSRHIEESAQKILGGTRVLSVGLACSDAPAGWAWVKLTDVARLESGHTPSRSHPEYWDGSIPWISIPDAHEHHGRVIFKTEQCVTPAGIENSAARVLPAGTVCLSRTASVGYCVVMGREMATSQDFVNWSCGEALEPRFLQLVFLAEDKNLRRFGKGSTHTTIYFPEVLAFHVCLPPISEQRRIVAKLDALLARSCRAKDALDAVPALLERFRQSIFSAAFRGDLTRNWRKQNPDVEPASRLLERISSERRRRWEEEELKRMRANGMTPRDDSWRARYMPAAPRSTSVETDVWPLPEGWLWVRAEELCGFITKGTTPPSSKMNASGEVPFIKVYNLTDTGALDFSVNPTFVSKDTHLGELARSRVRPGDVLMNIVGPPLGKVSIVPDTHPEWNMNQAVAVFPPASLTTSEYLAQALLCHGILDWAIQRAKATSGQVNLTLEICRRLPIPLPPLDEQQAICKQLNAALRGEARLRQLCTDALERVGALDERVLHKAFRGELVSKDPADEPASFLSKRIRAAKGERDEDDSHPRRRGPKKKVA